MRKFNYKIWILSIAVFLCLLAWINKNNEDIQSVRYIINLDSFLGQERTFITITDSLDIYSYKTYKIYCSPWVHDSLKLEKDTMRTISSRKIRAYLVVKEGEKKGYWYDDFSVKNPFIADVDSLLTKRYTKNFPFYIKEVQKLLNKTTHNGIDIETYVCKEKKDRSTMIP